MVYAIMMLVGGAYASFIFIRHLKLTYDLFHAKPWLLPDPSCRACGKVLGEIPSNLGHDAHACVDCLPLIEDELEKMLPAWFTNPLPKEDPDAQFGPVEDPYHRHLLEKIEEVEAGCGAFIQSGLAAPQPRMNAIPSPVYYSRCRGCASMIVMGDGLCDQCIVSGIPYVEGGRRW